MMETDSYCCLFPPSMLHMAFGPLENIQKNWKAPSSAVLALWICAHAGRDSEMTWIKLSKRGRMVRF